METLERIVLEQKIFAGLDPDIGTLITGCARNHHFEPGAYLFHEGEEAGEFFLVRHGEVALEITSPGRLTSTGPPQRCTLPQPAVRDGQVVIRQLMKMTLSVDHRLIDGALGAQFINAVKAKLEDIELWKRLTS